MTMKYYDNPEYQTTVRVGLLGDYIYMTVSKFARLVQDPIENDDQLLKLISCLDDIQEDADFTNDLVKMISTKHVDWIIEAEMYKDDIDWYQDIIDHFKGLVKKLEDNQ